jgi:hypothetical protein
MKLMKKLFMNVFLLAGIAAATLLLGGNAQAMLIDDFNGNYGEVTGEANLSQPYFNAWGGRRTLQIFGSANDRLSVELETGAGINGILWHENGDDRANDSLVRWSQGEPDLTDGGNSDRFAIEFLSVRSDDQFNLRVDGGVNSRSVDFTVAGQGIKTILFSDFGLSPSDFESVSVIELNITGTSRLASIQIDSIQTTGPVPPVTIGGTVTGLEGSGLVLQNNGADDEPIAADGEFTFDTLLAPGSSYNVTVATSPINPEQECFVARGSGTVPTIPVTNVAVICAPPDVADLAYVSKTAGCNGNSPCYTSINNAIRGEASGTEIRITAADYNEAVILLANKGLTLSGGWNSDYSNQSSQTTIDTLTVENGRVETKFIVIDGP